MGTYTFQGRQPEGKVFGASPVGRQSVSFRATLRLLADN
jgi:hypothetical protein